MKKFIPVVVLASLALVGCSNKKPAPAPAPATPVELTPPPAPAPEPVYTPAPQPTPAPTAAVDKPVTKAVPAKTETKAAPVKTASTSSNAKTYLIKKGDTLSEIASAHKTTVKKIMALNPEIKDADAIYVGQKLKMP